MRANCEIIYFLLVLILDRVQLEHFMLACLTLARLADDFVSLASEKKQHYRQVSFSLQLSAAMGYHDEG